MSLFANDSREIAFFTAKSLDGEETYCDPDEAILRNINPNIDVKTIERHTCKVREPSFLDTMSIAGSSQVIENGIPRLDLAKYDRKRIAVLVQAWTLMKGGQPLPITEESISRLPPEVEMVIAYLLNNSG